eukprot:COSAG02_NODE_870_length_16337_cov_45.593608_4_plen_288_part_00
MFNKIDVSGDGSVSMQELQARMESLPARSRGQWQAVMNEMDKDGSGEIEFVEFDSVVGKWIRAKLLLGLEAALELDEKTAKTVDREEQKQTQAELQPDPDLTPEPDAQLELEPELEPESKAELPREEHHGDTTPSATKKPPPPESKPPSPPLLAQPKLEPEAELESQPEPRAIDPLTVDARRTFDAIDSDGSGSISCVELNELARKMEASGHDPRPLRSILTQLDVDRSGEIEYDEWQHLWTHLSSFCSQQVRITPAIKAVSFAALPCRGCLFIHVVAARRPLCSRA